MGQRVRLVDATLRDGSYCVNFQFTPADTAVLVSMLDAAGVEFIEVGNGIGAFNRLAPPHLRSRIRQAATDEEYMAVARKCAKRAKVGIITGPFAIDMLHIVAEHRIDFVRLACMADRALEPANLAMAARAKSLGLVFSVNLMQTTALSPAQLAKVAVEYAQAGTDWFYIVDSSGGLLPQQVAEYVDHVRDSGMTVGFHAHHNSGLAVANSLAAISAGAQLVDGTLQGLGRDVGNTPTEQLLFMLQRLGHERRINVEHVSHAGDLVRRLMERGNDPTFYAAGSSEVHSSNVDALVAYAGSKGLGARSFLGAIGHGTTKLIGAGMKVFPEEIIAPASERAARIAEPTLVPEVVEILAGDIARASTRSLAVLADVLFARAAKLHARSVLHLVPVAELPFDGPLAWRFDGLCGVTVGVTSDDVANVDFGDRKPDMIVADPSITLNAPSITDAFAPLVIDATLAIAAIAGRSRIVCSDRKLASQLEARGATLLDGALDQVTSDSAVIVVDRDVSPAIAALASRGVRVLRPAFATTIAARIALLVDLQARYSRAAEGDLVDPIFIPRPGQRVVDDPECPTTVVDHAEPEACTAAATARARALAVGRGQL